MGAEQAVGNNVRVHWSHDIYGWRSALTKLLTGHLPFAGNDL